MKGRTLTLLDGTYAIGLYWRHETDRPKKKRLRELARERGPWGLTRHTTDGAFQVGLSPRIDGVRRLGRLRSLADQIAEVNTAPWRGVYNLGDGQYWYVAVGAGSAMLPDGDRVCDEEELAKLLATHGNQSWSEHRGGLEELENAVAAGRASGPILDLSPSWRLPLPNLGRGARATLAVAVALGCLAVGAFLVMNAKDQSKRQAEAAEREQKALASLQAPATVVARIKQVPWELAPASSDVFGGCGALWSKQELAKGGWDLVRWRCTVTGNGLRVIASWRRGSGEASTAPGVIQPTGTGDLAVSVSSLEREWSTDSEHLHQNLLQLTEVRRPFWSLAQRFELGLQIAGNTDQSKDSDWSDWPFQEDSDPKDWRVHRLSWTLPFAPWLGFGPGFDAVPGLRSVAVSADLTNDTWSVASNLYTLPERKEGN